MDSRTPCNKSLGVRLATRRKGLRTLAGTIRGPSAPSPNGSCLSSYDSWATSKPPPGREPLGDPSAVRRHFLQRPDTQLRIRAFCPGIFAFLAVFRRLLAELHHSRAARTGWLAAEPKATPQTHRLRPGASQRSAPATQASFLIMGYNESRWSSASSLVFRIVDFLSFKFRAWHAVDTYGVDCASAGQRIGILLIFLS